jgi:integrase
MTYLNAVVRSAYATGRIGRDPTIGTRSRRRRADDGGVGPDDVPTREEVLAILDAAPARYRAGVALGVTGLRIGEVLGLSADRVDLEARLVVIDRQGQRFGETMTFTTPKGEKARTIKIPERVAEALAEHPRDLRAGGLLFATPRSGRMMRRDEFYASAWHPALAGAGLGVDRFVFHSLRHWCRPRCWPRE